MNVLGIIPARGGSKGVPKKNIKPINDIPLIHYSLVRGLESRLITDLYLSTDSDEIISTCSSFEDLKIHKRPSEFAQDFSPTSDAVRHLLKIAEKENQIKYDFIILLQPTSPIRLKGEIDLALNQMYQSNCNSLISVCANEDVHPARMYEIKDDQLSTLIANSETKRRQELEKVYFRDGCFYIVRRDSFIETTNLMVKPSSPFVRDSSLLLNIDSMRDLLIAEVLIKEYFEP
jgi:CMP-N,N'-diacetyllegionaminic acid synthase